MNYAVYKKDCPSCKVERSYVLVSDGITVHVDAVECDVCGTWLD